MSFFCSTTLCTESVTQAAQDRTPHRLKSDTCCSERSTTCCPRRHHKGWELCARTHTLFSSHSEPKSEFLRFSLQLLQLFKPRLILSGHTHSGCEVLHENKYPEVSVPSFSWRNRNNPSIILVSSDLFCDVETVTMTSFNNSSSLQASVSPITYSLSKCFLPEESTVISVYCSAGACLLLLFLAHCLWMKGLLQCLSLCLLGKHKSLWTPGPYPQCSGYKAVLLDTVVKWRSSGITDWQMVTWCAIMCSWTP